jgi:hypothetical protein
MILDSCVHVFNSHQPTKQRFTEDQPWMDSNILRDVDSNRDVPYNPFWDSKGITSRFFHPSEMHRRHMRCQLDEECRVLKPWANTLFFSWLTLVTPQITCSVAFPFYIFVATTHHKHSTFLHSPRHIASHMLSCSQLHRASKIRPRWPDGGW